MHPLTTRIRAPEYPTWEINSRFYGYDVGTLWVTPTYQELET